MRIASYNIRKAVGLDWRRDAGRILDVLGEIEADVVVLQEADKRFGSRAGVLPLGLLESDLGLIPADVSVRPNSHGWHGNAILHSKRFGVHRADRIDIPTAEPRGAVSLSLEAPEIEIIGVHLGLTAGMRRRQMRALADRITNATHPVVIAGDFNEWAPADGGVFGDAATMIIPGPSFHASRPRVAFDRFVLSGPVEHVSAHVHKSALARRASDHLPVVLDIALSGEGNVGTDA